MKVLINIPDDISLLLPSASIIQKELRSSLAINLYKKGILGLGKASELARMDRFSFMKLLSEEGIALNYDVEEFEEDLETIERMSEGHK